MVPSESRRNQIRSSAERAAIRRRRPPDGADTCDQGRHPYRYYVSLSHLNGESKTAAVGSVSRVAAAEIENIVVKSLNEHLADRKEKPASGMIDFGDRKAILDKIARIDVSKDRLLIRFKTGEETDSSDRHLLSVPWQKPPSRKSRQILIPNGASRNEVRPTR